MRIYGCGSDRLNLRLVLAGILALATFVDVGRIFNTVHIQRLSAITFIDIARGCLGYGTNGHGDSHDTQRNRESALRCHGFHAS